MPTQDRSAGGKTVTEKPGKKKKQLKVAMAELRTGGSLHGP